MAGLVPAIHVLAAPRKTWMRGTSPRMTIHSIDLDLGILDDFFGFRHLVVSVFGEVLAGRADRLEAERAQTLFDVGELQRPGDLALQPGRDIGGEIFRSPQGIPRHELEAGDAGFRDRRNLGRGGGALAAGEPERLDLAALRQLFFTLR